MKKFKEYFHRVVNPVTPIDHLDKFIHNGHSNWGAISVADPDGSAFRQMRAELIQRGARDTLAGAPHFSTERYYECVLNGLSISLSHFKMDKTTVIA